jgi:integrase
LSVLPQWKLEFFKEKRSVKRHKTKYPGVYYREVQRIGSPGIEKVYYIVFKKDGNVCEEKVGRQFVNDMTPARAAHIRSERIEGKRLSRKELREQERLEREAEENVWSINRLWEEYRRNRPDNKARSVDEGRYKNYIHSLFGDREPQDILPLDVDRMRIKLLAQKSPQSVKHVLGLLNWIINFGVKRGLCSPLTFRIKKPEVHNEVTEYLTDEQLRNLLRAIDNDDNICAANLMRLALFTGMRRGELLKLKWEDIDFTHGFIRIRDPKGKKPQSIPLNEASRGVLDGLPRSDSQFVFPGSKGNQRVEINRQVRKIANRAGLGKDFRPLHGLRHAYASMLASSGQVDMYTLQKLLTHKSPMMTQRYAHLRDETLRKASNLAGSIISQVINRHEQNIISSA